MVAASNANEVLGLASASPASPTEAPEPPCGFKDLLESLPTGTKNIEYTNIGCARRIIDRRQDDLLEGEGWNQFLVFFRVPTSAIETITGDSQPLGKSALTTFDLNYASFIIKIGLSPAHGVDPFEITQMISIMSFRMGLKCRGDSPPHGRQAGQGRSQMPPIFLDRQVWMNGLLLPCKSVYLSRWVRWKWMPDGGSRILEVRPKLFSSCRWIKNDLSSSSAFMSLYLKTTNKTENRLRTKTVVATNEVSEVLVSRGPSPSG